MFEQNRCMWKKVSILVSIFNGVRFGTKPTTQTRSVVGGFNTSNNATNNTTTELKPTTTQHPAQTAGKMSIKQQTAKYNNLSQEKLPSSGQPTTRKQGHHPRMVTIIPLSPGSTQPAVYTIRTRLGGPYPRSFPKGWSFPLEFTIG